MGDGWHDNGADVTVLAKPASGFFFHHWSGEIPSGDSTRNPPMLRMDRRRAVTAHFEPLQNVIRYASPQGRNLHPYTTWDTAATEIQTAVDAAYNGDTVLVAAGRYVLAGPLVITNRVTLESAQGAQETILDGNLTTRCVYLAGSNAVLRGFTLTRGNAGAARGGGVYLEEDTLVERCVIVSNTAYGSCGGGAYFLRGGTVQNCELRGNGTGAGGGGAYLDTGGTIRNCLVVGNVGSSGAGIYTWSGGTVQNCTVVGNTGEHGSGGLSGHAATVENTIAYFNLGPSGPADWTSRSANWLNCCAPQPPPGSGHVTRDPHFVGPGGTDYRLHRESPCVDAGTDREWMLDGVDLDGVERIRGSGVNMGAYEYVDESAAPEHYVQIQTGTGGTVNAESGWFVRGSYLHLTAHPNDGYVFSDWTGDAASVSNHVALFVDRDLSVLATFRIPSTPVHYVSLSGDHEWPFTDWVHAATNLQAAIEAASDGDAVLVAAGQYMLSTNAVVPRGITVTGVDGAEHTIVDGNHATRCFLLDHPDAILEHLTIRNGKTPQYGKGGGIYMRGGTVRHCLITDNEATDAGGIY